MHLRESTFNFLITFELVLIISTAFTGFFINKNKNFKNTKKDFINKNKNFTNKKQNFKIKNRILKIKSKIPLPYP